MPLAAGWGTRALPQCARLGPEEVQETGLPAPGPLPRFTEAIASLSAVEPTAGITECPAPPTGRTGFDPDPPGFRTAPVGRSRSPERSAIARRVVPVGVRIDPRIPQANGLPTHYTFGSLPLRRSHLLRRPPFLGFREWTIVLSRRQISMRLSGHRSPPESRRARRLHSAVLSQFLMALGIIAIEIVAGSAVASQVWVPPFSSSSTSTILSSPVTWNSGCGSVLFNAATSASLTTGAVVIDSHAYSCTPGPGTHGSDGVEAGFSLAFNCGARPTYNGNETLFANYTGTWYTEADLSCTSGGSVQTVFEVVVLVINRGSGLTYSQSTTVVSSLSYTTTAQVVKTGTMGSYSTTFPYLLPGYTWFFETYVWGETYAYCPSGGSGSTYSEVDIGSR